VKRLALTLFALLLCAGAAHAQPHPAPDDWAVQLDLPAALRMKNVGGTDGAGLCVWTSITHSARWQGEAALYTLRADMEKKKGGGWPERVDQELSARGVRYLQYEGRDLEALRAATGAGLMPAVTWNGRGDKHYGGRPIAHMVTLVHADGQHFAILDNNFPGTLTRMSPQEFLAGFAGQGSGWAVFLLDRAPPLPAPVNARAGQDAAPFAGTEYEWTFTHRHRGYLFLWNRQTGRQVGVYDVAAGTFRHIDHRRLADGAATADAWLSPGPSPLPLPANAFGLKREGSLGTVRDFGVVGLDQLPYRSKKDERWTQGGKATDRATALQLLAWPRGKRSLSIVLPADQQQRVFQDLAGDPALQALAQDLAVRAYAPGDALAAGVGAPPGLTVQAPPDKDGRGKVLHRQADYRGAAQLAQALRRTAPDYDPAKDPDVTRPPAPPAPKPGPDARPAPAAPAAPALPLLPAAAVAAGALALLYALRKREVI
jgi:hypothetical protein